MTSLSVAYKPILSKSNYINKQNVHAFKTDDFTLDIPIRMPLSEHFYFNKTKTETDTDFDKTTLGCIVVYPHNDMGHLELYIPYQNNRITLLSLKSLIYKLISKDVSRKINKKGYVTYFTKENIKHRKYNIKGVMIYIDYSSLS